MAERGERGDGRSRDRAVYIISVAAELAGVHPQTLRIYERKGLLRPRRTPGNTRRYSDWDIERLQMIQDLTQRRGVNLAGVKMIIELQAELEALRKRTAELERELRRTRRLAARADAFLEGAGAIVPLRSIPRFPWLSVDG